MCRDCLKLSPPEKDRDVDMDDGLIQTVLVDGLSKTCLLNGDV